MFAEPDCQGFKGDAFQDGTFTTLVLPYDNASLTISGGGSSFQNWNNNDQIALTAAVWPAHSVGTGADGVGIRVGVHDVRAGREVQKQLKKLKPSEQWDSRQTVEVAITVLQAAADEKPSTSISRTASASLLADMMILPPRSMMRRLSPSR